MFDSIEGRLAHREPARSVVEAGGIGYEIHVPLSTYEDLPPTGNSVRLLVHLVVRETEWRLYGFLTESERDVFRALLRVSGVGPVMAQGLLSGLAPDEFQSAVTQGNVRALTRVKGIGKKTAERIVVELRDVMERTRVVVPAGNAASVPESVRDDAVRALMALGVDALEAQRKVDLQLGTLEEPTVSDLVRGALRG